MNRARGAASVLVITMCGIVLGIGVALGATSGLVVAHRRAQAAADLAALAAAGAAARGGDACAIAGETAVGNAARVTTCSVTGADVTVTVSVTATVWWGWSADLSARARAGPAA